VVAIFAMSAGFRYEFARTHVPNIGAGCRAAIQARWVQHSRRLPACSMTWSLVHTDEKAPSASATDRKRSVSATNVARLIGPISRSPGGGAIPNSS
jgi:hypothetical protein